MKILSKSVKAGCIKSHLLIYFQRAPGTHTMPRDWGIINTFPPDMKLNLEY